MQSVLAQSPMTVVQPCGHLNASNAVGLQQQLMSAVSSQCSSTVLVDMSQVESLDSAGLMSLVSALTLSQRLNQKFGLCCVSPSIRIIFELTQLDRAFEIFDSRSAFESAVA
jgi:anti-sigma B factor antagonist